MNDLKVGDTIKCKDPDDMIEVMDNLARVGIDTDFMYEKDGLKGYWLVVVDYGKKHNAKKKGVLPV